MTRQKQRTECETGTEFWSLARKATSGPPLQLATVGEAYFKGSEGLRGALRGFRRKTSHVL